MNVKGIIFDKDGTLMEYEAFWVKIAEAAVTDALVKIGADTALLYDIMKASGCEDGVAAADGVMCSGTYKDFSDIMWEILDKHGTSVEKDVLLKQITESYYASFSMGEVVPVCDNLRDVLVKIKSKGIKIALVTNDSVKGTEHCLEILGISHLFDKVYADDGIAPAKPDPYRINQFCSEENISPENVIVVGDTIADMLFAKNAGVAAVGVAKNEHNRKILEQYAPVIGNVSELAL
ncbi:MAG: HAD family hydrolase [Clostridia bacterium]|nr:HAD family hydrolase [Clostridia bacterium]